MNISISETKGPNPKETNCLCSGYLRGGGDLITAGPGLWPCAAGWSLPLCATSMGAGGAGLPNPALPRAVLGSSGVFHSTAVLPHRDFRGETCFPPFHTGEFNFQQQLLLGKDSGHAGSLVLVPLINGVTWDLRALRETESPSSLRPVPVLSDTPRFCSSCVHLPVQMYVWIC